jgi:hypothetical protein
MKNMLPADLCRKMYREGSPDIRTLYKYKSFNSDRLEFDFLHKKHWFSASSDLNDPFDIQMLLPEKVNLIEIEEILRVCKSGDLTRVIEMQPDEIAAFVGQSSELKPLEELFILLIQFGSPEMIRHLLKMELTGKWATQLFYNTREMILNRFSDLAVFCISEDNRNRLMWSHYGAAYSGYAIGYLAPTGIANPRTVQKVNYNTKSFKCSVGDLIVKPGEVSTQLMTTKSKDWEYEHEWRMIVGGGSGAWGNILPISEVVFGYKMTNDQKTKIKSLLEGESVRYFTATPITSSENFEVRIAED